MRSKTSSFEKTLFRKNLTRFAPVWAGYLACLLLGMVLLLGDEADFWRANNFAALCGASGLINAAFALLVVAMLFGDLYNSRMCNALHAMPVTRDSFYTTNLVTGLLFSLVPTTVMALCAIPFLAATPVANAWAISLYWLAVTNLQYLFFFGLAVLCAFCVGSRVGLAALYAVINVCSFLVMVLVEYLYIPMHYGVINPSDPYMLLCPIYWLSDKSCYVDMRSWQVQTGHNNYETHGAYTLDSGSWIYLFVVAAIGLVLLIIARQLYRKRSLECAGDLVAFPKLAPMAAVFGAFAGSVAFLVFCQMAYNGSQFPMMYLFLFLGLATGWFAAKMLLERNLRVFRKENIKGLVILAAILGGSLIVNYLDPLNIEGWVPDAGKVESVTLDTGYRSTIDLEDKEDIAQILALHAFSAEEKLTDDMVQQERMAVEANENNTEYDYPRYLYYTLKYELTNGWTSQRQYRIRASDAPADIIRRYTSSLESIFFYGETYGETFTDTPGEEKIFSPDTREELLAFAEEPLGIQVGQVNIPKAKLTKELVVDLFNAIADDCEAGSMSQEDNFHPLYKVIVHDNEDFYDEKYGDDFSYHTHSGFYLRISLNDTLSIGLNFFMDSRNILAWAEENGITVDQMIRKSYDVTNYELEETPFTPGFEVSPYSYAPAPTEIALAG